MKKLLRLTFPILILISFFLVTCTLPVTHSDQSNNQDQKQIEINEKTYTTGKTGVSHIPIDRLCGLKVPENWQKNVHFSNPLQTLSSHVQLPASYDWRDNNGVTPIKNQASCGSCWAFGTVGILESAVKIAQGDEVDLSEQYLVSCNNDNWGCNGGWWAHDYHKDGAVKESCYPYTATDSACKQGCPKFHKIKSWHYITNQSSVPSVDALKAAIHQYGPVAVAVYVNSSFQHYTGGVFNGTASGQVNHAVILVGWDDAKQAWILRNSWGTGWGINGYMYIKYGSQQVGYAANYVILDNVNPKPAIDFSADKTALKPGQSSQLTWKVSNADTVTASGDWSGSKSLTGNYNTGALNQEKTYTYTLTAKGKGGTTEKSINIIVSKDSGITDGIYKITSRFSGKSIYGSRFFFSYYVKQYTYDGKDDMKWKIEALGNGYYKFININYNKALYVDDNTAGSMVYLNTFDNNDNKCWKIQAAGNGYYLIINKSSGLALDVNSKSNSSYVYQDQVSQSDDRLWKLEKLN